MGPGGERTGVDSPLRKSTICGECCIQLGLRPRLPSWSSRELEPERPVARFKTEDRFFFYGPSLSLPLPSGPGMVGSTRLIFFEMHHKPDSSASCFLAWV